MFQPFDDFLFILEGLTWRDCGLSFNGLIFISDGRGLEQ